MIKPDEVFSLLGVKDAIDNSRYFVGRDELVSNLSCSVIGKQRSPCWIYGPRRIGKSSIAKAIARKGEENNTLVFWIDAIDINSGVEEDFDDFDEDVEEEEYKEPESAEPVKEVEAKADILEGLEEEEPDEEAIAKAEAAKAEEEKDEKLSEVNDKLKDLL